MIRTLRGSLRRLSGLSLRYVAETCNRNAVVQWATGDRPVYWDDVFDVLDKRQRLRSILRSCQGRRFEGLRRGYSGSRSWHSEIAMSRGNGNRGVVACRSTDPPPPPRKEDIEVLKPRAATCFAAAADGVRPRSGVLSATTRGAYIEFGGVSNQHDAWRRCHWRAQTTVGLAGTVLSRGRNFRVQCQGWR